MDIQAIFFDIDGTLVSFNTHKIPPSTLQAIEALRKKNIKLIVATGRSLLDINHLGNLKFDGYITANGAYCTTDKKELLYRRLISDDDLQKLIRYQTHSEFPCIFMTEKGNFANYIDDSVRAIHNLVNLSLPPVRPIEEIVKYGVFQIDAYITEKKEKIVIQDVLKGCEGNRWHPSFVDINAKGNNKATGVKIFLEYYNIPRKNTMAFGDGGNDISMLEYVALGVAMGDATDDVIKVADYLTTSVDDDGIMAALKRYKILCEQ